MATPFHLVAAASTNATVVTDAAARLTGWYLSNKANGWRYVKLYDKASAPNPATDTPKLTIALPRLSSATVGLDSPLEFENGIALLLTTGLADTDSAAVGAGDLHVDLTYT